MPAASIPQYNTYTIHFHAADTRVPAVMEFRKTQKDKPLLVYQEYNYLNDNKTDKVLYWRCEKKGCT